jgi:PDZ domain-containing protein
MSRQLRTLLLGAVLVLVLGLSGAVFRVPYVVLSPGPTVNTLGRDGGTDIIAIKGHPISKTTGNLNLTTVSVETQDTTVYGAITGWLAGDEAVVPHDSVYPPGQSEQQTNARDKQDFIQSQNSAIVAASCELGYPTGIGVLAVNPDSPNVSVLKEGDKFVSFNGVPVSDDAALRKVLSSLSVGAKVPVVVSRAGVDTKVMVTLSAPPSGSKIPLLGITLQQGCLPPFQISLALAGIGGPSAGLMFALGIVDKISTDDLTHGRFIAGTGMINADGSVAPIGGIQLKMLAARRAGATVFLAPAGNCNDVRGSTPSGLNVIKVSSLHDAITSLNAVNAVNAANAQVPHC